jgi:quercetin dioxygenase-like cupin family protein
MLSTLSLLFFLPAALLLWVPILAIINGVYDGDQAMAGAVGLLFAVPGFVLVAIDVIRKGWRRAFTGFVGVGLLATPFVAILAYGGVCELAGSCREFSQPRSQQAIEAVRSSELVWREGADNRDLTSAWAIGKKDGSGLYVVRSKLPQGTRVQPHAHSRERVLSIVSGVLHLVSGDEFIEGKLLRYSAGDLVHVPAHVMHYFAAPEGDVVMDEYGQGPVHSYASEEME